MTAVSQLMKVNFRESLHQTMRSHHVHPIHIYSEHVYIYVCVMELANEGIIYFCVKV